MRRVIFFVIAAFAFIVLFAGTAYADDLARPSYASEHQTMMATVLTILITALFTMVCVMLMVRTQGRQDSGRMWPAFVFAAALAIALRVIAALVFKGYETDIGCFKGWAMGVYEYGPAHFYTSGMFSDYPPGYMYVLWVLGFVRDVFSIEMDSAVFTLIIKLPSIIAEVVTAVIVYRLASRQIGKTFGLLCSSFLLFNPALFFNSSVWGQIDAFFILFAVLTLHYLKNKNFYLGALFFALALLIKPQALILAPVVGLCYVYALFKKGGFTRGIVGVLGGAVVFAAVFAAGVLPFTGDQPIGWIVGKYAGTINSYEYASLNAFNLFALTGGNWQYHNQPLWLLTYETWGLIFIGLICVAVIILQWRSRENGRVFELGAFVVVSVFMLAHSMHERYMLPACVFLLFGYVFTRDRVTLLYAAAFSITTLFNQMVTLLSDSTAAAPLPTLVISAINVALFIGFVVHMTRRLWSDRVLIKPPALNG